MKPNSAEHEAKCQRCGISCHGSLQIGARQVVVEGLHCRFYGTASDGQPGCTVYKDRFEKAPWCLDVVRARNVGALRVGCPYSFPLSTWGKERLDPAEYDLLWPQIADALRKEGALNPAFAWREFALSVAKREPQLLWSEIQARLPSGGEDGDESC